MACLYLAQPLHLPVGIHLQHNPHIIAMFLAVTVVIKRPFQYILFVGGIYKHDVIGAILFCMTHTEESNNTITDSLHIHIVGHHISILRIDCPQDTASLVNPSQYEVAVIAVTIVCLVFRAGCNLVGTETDVVGGKASTDTGYAVDTIVRCYADTVAARLITGLHSLSPQGHGFLCRQLHHREYGEQ